jgi:hypothetical protein
MRITIHLLWLKLQNLLSPPKLGTKITVNIPVTIQMILVLRH